MPPFTPLPRARGVTSEGRDRTRPDDPNADRGRRAAQPAARDLLAEDPEFVLIGECGDGTEAAALLRESSRAIWSFWMCRCPAWTDWKWREDWPRGCGPAVIFVTAYDCYALPAFDVHAVDYLLKPFDRDRFHKALARAKAAVRRDGGESAAAPAELPRDRKPLDRITIKTAGRIYFLNTTEIDWVEAAGNYLRLHTGAKSHMLRETMNNLERVSTLTASGASIVPPSSTSIASANCSRCFTATTS